MAFNINDYKQNVAQYDILRNNRFQVNIAVPPILSGSSVITGGGQTPSNDITKLLSFRAEQFRAPGINLDTKNAYRYGMGAYQKMPFSGRYTDNTLTFLSDGYGIMWNFWYQWINSIFNFAGNDGAAGSSIGGFNTLPSYQIEYKEKYATMVSVVIYNVKGQEVQTINLYDAYPVSLNDVQLAWGTKNEALRITVGLTFKEFTIQRSSIAGSYNASNQNPSAQNARRQAQTDTNTIPYVPGSPTQQQNVLQNFFQQQGTTSGASNPPIPNPR